MTEKLLTGTLSLNTTNLNFKSIAIYCHTLKAFCVCVGVSSLNFNSRRGRNCTFCKIVMPPNFEEIEMAYWFGSVHLCVRLLRFAYGQERLEIQS